MAVQVGTRDAYVGETNKQIREGFGVYNYENKYFRYEGEWKAGKKHGHGKLVMSDGSYYEGTFQNGEIEGHGFRYYAQQGNTYSGEFHQGELHGQGIMKYRDGSMYEGMWAFNKRSGYGVFKREDNSTFQGYLHNNMRHGEGTQIYSNGDRYDGDWVNDKRQGHGELRCADGSLFDGQWRNDLFNGQGTMHHSSGMIYEGIWVNGHPANMSSKLVITDPSPIEIVQGNYFQVTVQSVNDMGEATDDQGREILVTAGYKNILPKLVDSKSKKSNTELQKLFEVIEDVEDKPISTPFGYDVLNYPVTDQMEDRATLGDPPEPVIEPPSRQVTSLTEGDMTRENTENPTIPESGETEQPKQDETADKKETGAEEKKIENEAKPEGEAPKSENEAQGSSEQPAEAPAQETAENVADPAVTVAPAPPDTAPVPPEVSLPPPASSQRTESGKCVFTNLILPAPPPMYRPFLVLEEEAKMEKMKQLAKAGKKVSKDKLAQDDSDSDDDSDEEDQKSRYKKLGDERFARPGEYVIMVQDVTNPPFMGVTLEPAFILVKTTLPKRAKKVVKKEKEKGPSEKPGNPDVLKLRLFVKE